MGSLLIISHKKYSNSICIYIILFFMTLKAIDNRYKSRKHRHPIYIIINIII